MNAQNSSEVTSDNVRPRVGGRLWEEIRDCGLFVYDMHTMEMMLEGKREKGKRTALTVYVSGL